MNGDAIWDIELLTDGFLLFGGTNDSLNESVGIWIFKIDNNGNKLFDKSCFIPNKNLYAGWANGSDKIDDNSFVTIGTIDSAGVSSLFLAKCYANGDTAWANVYNTVDTNAYITGRCVLVSNEGDFLIGGATNEPGYVCGFVLKTNPFGEELWREYYGTESQMFGVTSLAISPEGSAYIIGGRNQNPSTSLSEDSYIYKINLEGNVEWEMSVGDLGFDDAAAHVIYPYENVCLIAGSSAINSSAGSSDEYLAITAVNQDGDMIYSNIYGEHNWQTALTSIKHVAQLEYIAAGYTYDELVQVGVMMRIDESGDSLWLRKYYWLEGNYCYFRDVMPTLDGGFIAVGDAYPDQDAGVGFDGWVVKTDAFGCVVPGCQLAIEDIHTNVEVSVYPNPASDFTNVFVKTRDPGAKGVIQLYDELGNLLLTKSVIGGDLNIAIDVSSWPNGMYVLKYTNEQEELVVSKVLVER
ncbi:MAG: T9SS type A sorting domain-containing protein [Flavobacteriales bacterium]|nr:T9SS type A sorting domain-containing protein [Flavobacteriales bacterium]